MAEAMDRWRTRAGQTDTCHRDWGLRGRAFWSPAKQCCTLCSGWDPSASRRAGFSSPIQAEAYVKADHLLSANDPRIRVLGSNPGLNGTCRRASLSALTSVKGGTGKRWWYERARCGDDTSVRPHTWQLRQEGQGQGQGQGHWRPLCSQHVPLGVTGTLSPL